MANTNIIVLDEPTSNLDLEGIEALRCILAQWKSEGKTIIIAEHRLYFLRELADRVLVLKDGLIKVDQEGKDFFELDDDLVSHMGLRSTKLFPTWGDSLKKSFDKIIRFENIYFKYDKTHGIDIDNLEIPCEGITAIIGTNGAGKTTFARTICGLHKGAKGTAFIDGKRIKISNMLNNCYMVMQDVNHQLFTDSVLEEVLISVPNTISESSKKEKALEALCLLGLDELSEYHPMSLSGGQKQRLAIASAIAADKKILIFDEPTSGLDYLNMRKTAEVLKMLKEKGKTVIVITHDTELIALCADCIVRINSGKIE